MASILTLRFLPKRLQRTKPNAHGHMANGLEETHTNASSRRRRGRAKDCKNT